MALSAPLTRRRALQIAGSAALAGALPASAFAQSSVDVATLMAPNALPDMWLGKADAPVTIVEYASTTCTHCAAFHANTLPQLKAKYIETGKARFVLREFPLNPLDMAGYMLARCSGDDKRYAVLDLLFSQQKNWAFTDKPLVGLTNILRQTGMSQASFESCLKDKDMYDKVVQVRDRASEKFQVNSTPTFFVNGQRLVGDASLEEFEKLFPASVKS